MNSEPRVWLARRHQLKRLSDPKMLLSGFDEPRLQICDHHYAAAVHLSEFAAPWEDLVLRLAEGARCDFATADALLQRARDDGWLQSAESLPQSLDEDWVLPASPAQASQDEELLAAAGEWVQIGATGVDLAGCQAFRPHCWAEYLLWPEPEPAATPAIPERPVQCDQVEREEAATIWLLSAAGWHRRCGSGPPLALDVAAAAGRWPGGHTCATSPRYWSGQGLLNGAYCLPPLCASSVAYGAVLAALYPDCWQVCVPRLSTAAGDTVPTDLSVAVSSLPPAPAGRIPTALRYQRLITHLQSLTQLSDDALRYALQRSQHEAWQAQERWLHQYGFDGAAEQPAAEPRIDAQALRDCCEEYAQRLHSWPQRWAAARN